VGQYGYILLGRHVI